MRRTRAGQWAVGILAAGLVLLALLVGGCAEKMQGFRTAATALETYGSREELWVIPRDPGTVPRARGAPAGSGRTPWLPRSPMLVIEHADGTLAPMPAKHMDVKAEISGCIASVNVTQAFENNGRERMDAAYVFPLPENAGINDFQMTIGQRHIRGIIRERAEAEKIYADARAQGYAASMMEEEQPHVFVQKVANIEPGKHIDISIRYFHMLSYTDGWFEWVFPMGMDPDVTQPGGRDIALSVQIDAGMAIEGLASANHKIRRLDQANNRTQVQLDPVDAGRDKDFVLRYKVAGNTMKSGLWTQKVKDGAAGYFALLLVPPDDPKHLPGADASRSSAAAGIRVDFPDAMKVSEVFPQRIPDFAPGRPLIITGRYAGTAAGDITVSGRPGGNPVRLTLSASTAEENPALATLWACMKIAALRDQSIHENRDVAAEMKQTALTYGIVSEFTSFVTVDSTHVTTGDHGTSVAMPVPDGR